MLLIVLTGCASPAVMEEARTIQASTPRYRTPKTGGAPRTHLDIPAEFIEQLNWDPAAYRDLPVLFEDDGPRADDRTVETPQRRRRNSHARPRRRYRRAQRPFRTVGLSVTITPASGHPLGLPGHAVQRSRHPVGRPQHPVDRPAHAIGLPGHAVKRSNHPVTRPDHAVRRPNHPVRRPDHPVNRPNHPIRKSNHPVELPGHAIGLPGQSIRSVPR